MYLAKPYQFVKEHEDDYLFIKVGKHYVHSLYGGVIEVEKEEYEKLIERGMEEKNER